ncbi:MAG: phospholipase D family protein [Candidatus Methanospirareceae archaeon]
MLEITIVSTGEKWVGYGFRSFSSVIEEMMSIAEKEIVMTAYVISDMKVVDSVKNALERGISVEIFIYLPDSSQRTSAVNEIFKLSKEYRYLRIHTISDEVLHAKVLIVDGDRVLAGSANPTFGGMVKNYELGFLVKDGRIAQKVLTLLRRLK